MVELIAPLLYSGRLVPAGAKIALPIELEGKIISAGNGIPCEGLSTAEPLADLPEKLTERPVGPLAAAIWDAAMGRPGIQGATK